jgi:hypothetical protein
MEKYLCQREGSHYMPYPATDDDEDFSREKLIEMNKYIKWLADGKPTGIKSDEEFHEFQRKIYGKIIFRIIK